MSITDHNSISILASTPSPQPDDHIISDDILVDEDGSTHENAENERRTIPPMKPTRGFDDDSDDADELMISQLEEMNEAMASDLAEQDRLMAEKKKNEKTRKISEENEKIHEKTGESEQIGLWYEPEDEDPEDDEEDEETEQEDGHKNFMTDVPIDEDDESDAKSEKKSPEENSGEKTETKPEIPIDPFLGIPIDDDSEPEEEVLQTGQVSAAFGGPTPTKRAKISLDLISGVVSSDGHESEDNEEPSTFAQTLQSRFQPKQATTPVLQHPFLKQSSILKQSSSHSSSSATRRDPRQKPVSRPDFSSVNVPISSSASKKVGGGGEKPGKKSPNSDGTILKLKHIAKQFYDSIMKCDPAWRRFDSVKGIKAIYETLSTDEFFCDPEKISKCRIRDPRNPLNEKRRLHMYEYLRDANAMFVQKCREQKQTSLINECIKPTVKFLAKFANVYGFSTRLEIYHKELFVKTLAYNLSSIKQQKAGICNVTDFSKQEELTTRTIVTLLRSIGDMLKDIHDESSIHWLLAARTIDSNAACTYLAIADYYKRKISPSCSSDIILNYVYNYTRACNVRKHQYVIQRKLDTIKKDLNKRFTEKLLNKYKSKLNRYHTKNFHNIDIYIKNLEMYKGKKKHKHLNGDSSDVQPQIETGLINGSNAQSDTEITPTGLKDFCVFSLIGTIYGSSEHSIEDLSYFKKALSHIDENTITQEWMMKLFMIAILGWQEFAINVWPAILAIVDRNIQVIDLTRKNKATGQVEEYQDIQVLFASLSYYMLAWLGKNIDQVPLDKPCSFELGTSFVSPKQSLRKLERYLTADLQADFEFQNKMGLSNYLPFEKIESSDIVNIKFSSQDDETLLERGEVKITDRDAVRRYTVLEAVVFDDEVINSREIEDLLPKLKAKEICVAFPKSKSSVAVYKSISKKHKLVFKHAGGTFPEFYKHVSEKWCRRTRGTYIECTVGIVRNRESYRDLLKMDQILTVSELNHILN